MIITTYIDLFPISTGKYLRLITKHRIGTTKEHVLPEKMDMKEEMMSDTMDDVFEEENEEEEVHKFLFYFI